MRPSIGKFITLILLFTFITGGPAGAYVLQGFQILEMAVDRIGKSSSLQVSQKVVVHDVLPENEPVEFFQNLKYNPPEKFRSELLGKDSEWIHVRSEVGAVNVIDGKIVNVKETFFERYTGLLLFRSQNLLENHLATFGVDLSITSLGRFMGRVVYLIGAKYPDEALPQIWFDRDTFRPVRWLYTKGFGSSEIQLFEIRFLDWKPTDNTWYPMRLEFYRNSVKVREIKVVDIKVGASLSADQFNVQHIRSMYPRAENTGSHATGKPYNLINTYNDASLPVK